MWFSSPNVNARMWVRFQNVFARMWFSCPSVSALIWVRFQIVSASIWGRFPMVYALSCFSRPNASLHNRVVFKL